MEGLIPFIYRAIKRRRSRMYYKCLSYGNTSYNFHGQSQGLLPSPPRKFESFGKDRKVHRRRHTMDGFSDKVLSSEDDYERRRRLSKDVRSSSMRILACIGAAL